MTTMTNETKKALTTNISIKTKLNGEIRTMTLAKVLHMIKNGFVSDQVHAMRTKKASGDILGAKAVKDNLPLFYMTEFTDPTKSASMHSDNIHSGIMMFDIDGIDIATSGSLLSLLMGSMFADNVVFAFLSPSGGLKFGLNTTFTGMDNDFYKLCYKKVFQKLIDIGMPTGKLDKSTCNCNRGTYFSYDANLSLGKAIKLDLAPYFKEHEKEQAKVQAELNARIALSKIGTYNEDKAKSYADKVIDGIIDTMGKGNRHIGVFRICMTAFRCGLGIDGAELYLMKAKSMGQYTENMTPRAKAQDVMKSWDGIVDSKFNDVPKSQSFKSLFR